MRNFLKRHQSHLSYLTAGLGLIVYALKSWDIIHTVTSIVFDEGGYMARGYLLAIGKYWPYADYSIPLDHMPLSFLIPGYAQVLFGPGIRAGRYFSFGLGLIALIGLWIAARKLGGNWWAAITIWLLALNPVWIESHSLGFSQVLILFLTTWAFVFLIGERNTSWQIFLASFLAGLAGMTRLNLLPVVFLLILYIYWQHGKKAGILSLIGGITPIIFFHILYWPGIFRIWAYYIPEGIIPLIDTYRFPLEKNYIPEGFTLSGFWGNETHLLWDIIQAFWNGLLHNLFVVVGVLVVVMLWPRKKTWKSEYHRRLAFFLLATYVILFLMHMWAALSGTSCGFTCFKGYLMFFTNIGLFLIILTFPYWEKNLPLWRNILIGLFISCFLIALEYWNHAWQRNIQHIIQNIVELKIPRLNNPGTIEIWRVIDGKFGIPYQSLTQFLYTCTFWALPLGFVWVVTPLLIRGGRKFKMLFTHYGWALCTTLLLIIGILSPLDSIGGELNAKKCESDVLNSHEAVGKTLRKHIPAGAKVYWDVESWTMFLYIPDIEIYPPQTMIHYNFVPLNPTIDQDFVLRNGYWNEEFKELWIGDADFILVEGRYYIDEWRPRVEAGELTLIDITQPIEDCRGDHARILILQNNNKN